MYRTTSRRLTKSDASPNMYTKSLSLYISRHLLIHNTCDVEILLAGSGLLAQWTGVTPLYARDVLFVVAFARVTSRERTNFPKCMTGWIPQRGTLFQSHGQPCLGIGCAFPRSCSERIMTYICLHPGIMRRAVVPRPHACTAGCRDLGGDPSHILSLGTDIETPCTAPPLRYGTGQDR